MKRLSIPAALVLLASSQLAAAPSRAAAVDYQRDIKPLLKERCYACHGALEQEAGLRLDTVALMLEGGDSGAVLVAGEPAASLLLARVAASDAYERMPPEHEGEPLSAEEVERLRQWIADGAAAPPDELPETDPAEHWAFQPVVRPAVPGMTGAEWPRNPIDAFIAQQQQDWGVAMQGEASRGLLLRRLSLDLIGLPPTPEEIVAANTDLAPGWYSRTVERLLADPRYGERWGRHWMDIWRYSDWWGLGDQLRNSQQHIWHWRDWIVESLNAGLAYDEMVRLMLAADELHPNDLDRLRATGYLARNYFLFNRHQWMDETVEHVSKGFLGLTTNCAKCHDHKYDPISQIDYYAMRAFFEPYHVRMDVVPGEANLDRDGIPRAFDGWLDAPTYLFIRGQESQPDESAPISPSVPDALEFAELKIEPVDLPPEAWQPGRRVWVADAHRQAAKRKLQSAESRLATARQQLARAERAQAAVLKSRHDAAGEAQSPPAESAQASGGITEKFATLDERRWQLSGGDWVPGPSGLEQQQDGASRAAVRFLAPTPRDFDATVRFTILGGSRWRSVGIGFDAVGPVSDAAAAPQDSEQHVYVSAHAGGSKLQASHRQGTQWQYPADGRIALPIELDREYTLRVQVRGPLVNASLDGQAVLAWRSPLARRNGHFQITTFDALAVLHEVSLAPLESEVTLHEPGEIFSSPMTPRTAEEAVTAAQLSIRAAELALELAEAECQSINLRDAAQRAVGDAVPEAARAAARAERQQSVLQARLELAEAEMQLQAAAADKRPTVAKQVDAAKQKLAIAIKAAAEPSDEYTPLVGARWSATRFQNSSQDDPAVSFPSRSTGRRTALARWVTDPRNPLTARVAANHIWTRHFGRPLVPTVFDFGRNGSPPTHPELLDWLAAELVASGWDMKHLHRLIVSSATYRASSSADGAEANLVKDPENASYWRWSSPRMESQVVRDSILALTGSLDARCGGPPVPLAEQDASHRRSLYFFHSNNERNLFLTMFDEALVKECYRREQSIVPQQALALANSQLVLDAAPRIAARLTRTLASVSKPASGSRSDSMASLSPAAHESAGERDRVRGPVLSPRLASDGAAASDDVRFIQLAFTTLLGNEATAAELAACEQACAEWRGFADEPDSGAAAAAARAELIWVLLNHHDFVTRR